MTENNSNETTDDRNGYFIFNAQSELDKKS